MNTYKINDFIDAFAALSRRAAGEGAILLKNEEQVLPLKGNDKLSIFGRCQIDYYRTGTGSGGSVNVPYTTHLIDGLRCYPNLILNETLIKTYEEWLLTHPFDNGNGAWAAEPHHQEEMPLTYELVHAASQHSDKAIVVIGRTAGEDQDYSAQPGGWQLTADEINMLTLVTRCFRKVIVVLNVSGLMDMSWLTEEAYGTSIQGVLCTFQGGMEGGHAAADVLTGAVNPSGRLTETLAYEIEDYPSTPYYGDPSCNLYTEDIYVGYRYFETFCPSKVLYEFGYGLSYTTFDVVPHEAQLITQDGKQCLTVAATVTNTGSVPGREVVQLYYSAPQGRLGKPAKALMGFAKTEELLPGASETLTLTAPLDQMASYDDCGVTGHRSAYVLEAGDYTFFLGTSIRKVQRLTVAGNTGYHLPELKVVSQLEEALAPRESFQRLKPGSLNADGTYTLAYEQVPAQTFSMADRIQDRLPETLAYTGNQGYTLRDVYDKKVILEAFIAQLSPEELATLVRGEGMCSPLVTPGTASAFGGVSQSLRNYGIPAACTADGPSGIRMDSGHEAVQLPIGTLLASTWDLPLVTALYEMEGRELAANKIDLLLGPGLNIQRHPLNGRNFEYFSEDPLLTGCFATAITQGLKQGGAHATLKHFACNNQEHERYSVNAVVSERALREIYLKGFEMAIKEGDAKAVMTAYNPLNGQWTASHYDLTTTVLRKEWGFEGIVMTDWWAAINDVVLGGPGDMKQTASMIRAQNDLYMVVNNYGAEINSHEDDTLSALSTHRLELGELQRSAMNICRFIMETPAFLEPSDHTVTVPCFNSQAKDCQAAPLVLEQPLSLEETLTHTFNVTEGGHYAMILSLMSPYGPTAQSSCHLFLNDQLVTTVQTGGTSGRWIKQKLPLICLEPGCYTLRLEHVKTGLQLSWLTFSKQNH